ncbi:ThuA domain-containing protein [Novosphingobium sp. Gsoil 351]|uniref:ThuA domain-containing protein n=1 Tax=Novosphingobium sp. Gsoil 351 TaxID=2675225 RepID=UPI0012B4B55C|nr:ThuA domain-containing protein [Novosphingobium sp. Gsoil 351]QGN54273.1 ThuA domain-containing protein [Novosphingobium sp. Gsoil 351]
MGDLLVLSGGHPYEAEPFAEMLDSLDGWTVTHLLHPEAERLVGEGAADQADAILFYDMPGYTFGEGKVISSPPSEAFRRALMARFAAGRGAVAMHHALAGWALWPEWAELVGGRFLYQQGEVRGRAQPDSGYRHDVSYTAQVIVDHPVTRGLPSEFPVTDELYLAPVFGDDIVPLIRARHDFVRDNFFSAAAAVEGRMFSNAGWEHPDGNDCVAWAKPALNARLVYLQFGDGPATYANPHVRRLLANALDFVASPPT